MARRAFAQINFVPQLCPFLDWMALLIVTHALVTFHLAYCSVFYMELPMKTSQVLVGPKCDSASSYVFMPVPHHYSKNCTGYQWASGSHIKLFMAQVLVISLITSPPPYTSQQC